MDPFGGLGPADGEDTRPALAEMAQECRLRQQRVARAADGQLHCLPDVDAAESMVRRRQPEPDLVCADFHYDGSEADEATQQLGLDLDVVLYDEVGVGVRLLHRVSVPARPCRGGGGAGRGRLFVCRTYSSLPRNRLCARLA